MSSINQRLEIFCNSNIITNEEKIILEKWVNLINKYSDEIDEEKLERLITHSAMMMKRQRENDSFEELPIEIYKSIQEHELYNECTKLFDEMNALYPINKKEERYMILHLCNLISKE